MTRYYTRSGDDGFTGLLGEGRVPKYHPRTQAVGVLDEASAALGMARAICQVEAVREALLSAQRDLYHLMAEVSATPENAAQFRAIGPERVAWLEAQVEGFGEQVEMPREFILPGDTPAGAALALGRTFVRRAERTLAELLHSGEIENRHLLSYLNRLSSLCFVLELVENRASGKPVPTLARENR